MYEIEIRVIIGKNLAHINMTLLLEAIMHIWISGGHLCIPTSDSPTILLSASIILFRVDSPTKPILAVFSPTNRLSYSTVGLPIRWLRPVYHKSYFM